MITIKLGLMESVEAINKHKIDAIIRSALREEGYDAVILGAYEDESGNPVTVDFSVDDMDFIEKAIAGAVKEGFEKEAVEKLFEEDEYIAHNIFIKWTELIDSVQNASNYGESAFNDIVAEELKKYLPKVA